MNSKNRLALDLLRDYANKKQEKRNVIRNLLMQANTSPNYKKLDARERELIFLIASKESHNEDATELNLKLNKLKEIKNKVLMSLGINPQDLELKYDCEQCKDTGIVHNEYCTCFKNKLAQLALKDSGLDKNNLPSLKDFNTNIAENEEQKKELTSYRNLLQILSINFQF
ncbi:MAG: hypothetical protein RR334_01855 [Clostridia bacterium]